MRFLARLGLALCGLALATSAMVKADDPACHRPATPRYRKVARRPAITTKAFLVRGIALSASARGPRSMMVWTFPRRPCRAAMAGPVVQDHSQAAPCAACQTGTVVSGPVTIVESYPPGHAMVGGPAHGRQPSAWLRCCRWRRASRWWVRIRPRLVFPRLVRPSGTSSARSHADRGPASGRMTPRSAFEHDPGPDGAG